MKSSYTHKPAVIIPAFKRAASLRRLLQSVNEASYPDPNIKLLISIDGGATEEVIQAAGEFVFHAGSAEVYLHEENLGLRQHILWCAELTGKYGSVIILEDDLVVGPGYYRYAQNALEFYSDEPAVAGISLYSPRYNETARLPFEPLDDGHQAWFMQTGSSWGQAWTKEQWSAFREWYGSRVNSGFSEIIELPENVKNWPETSWKKYFNLYLVEQNKYIVYPYSSYSTNTGDHEGEHLAFTGSLLQVPLNCTEMPFDMYGFPPFTDDAVKYDAFMEAEGGLIETWTGIPAGELELDLYGSKPPELLRRKKFCITPRRGNNATAFYPLAFRPIELNLKFKFSQNKKAFFMLYPSGEVADEAPGPKHYFRMAEYFSYFNLKTKSFTVRFFIEVVKKFFRGSGQ